MKKILLSLIVLILTTCEKNNSSEFYNVIYNQDGNIIEYYDVTDLYYFNDYVYFTTCDGAIVHLSDGAIEIIPIDVD